MAGVSFHVGSAAADASAFTRAIAAARRVFDTAAAMEGGGGGGVRKGGGTERMSVVDIGGGFSAPPWRQEDGEGNGSGGMSFVDAARGELRERKGSWWHSIAGRQNTVADAI